MAESSLRLKWMSDTSTNLGLEDVGKYTKDELVKAVGDQQVVEVWIDGAIPDTVYSWSASLKKLTLEHSSISDDLKRLPELTNLMELRLSKNYFELSEDIFQGLSSLKGLYLDNCGLSSLPKSIEKLVNLEVLDLSGNNLERTTEYIGSLQSLKKLKLRECFLETLPQSMSQLVSLEELDLSYNDFSTDGLPDVVMDLSGLKELLLSYCQLDALLTRECCLSNLELLDLSFNRFEDHGLPEDIFSTFPNLTILKMDECRLRSLPKSIEKLSDLEELSLAGNRFETFPGTRKLTEKLKKLNLSSNRDLRSLNEEIVQVEKLFATDCVSLNSPPYKLFLGGIEKVKQYFSQKDRDPTRHIPITVVVLGYSQAGKSTLMKTLQSETYQRKFTNRKDEKEEKIWFDTATKVFSFEEVVKNGQVLKFIDLGGHEIYHVTYQLTFREKSIPVLVVSMVQFDEMSNKRSANEAVRMLAVNLMAHFYNPNSTPMKPTIVFTHKDKFSKSEFDRLRDDFLYLMKNMWKDEASENPNFFDGAKIYSIGKDGEFDDMKNHLFAIAQSQTKGYEPPESWPKVEQLVRQQANPTCELSQILKEAQECHKISEDDTKNVLKLMHDCGLLLWYKDDKILGPYVFLNLFRITELLIVLYDHNEKEKWVKRKRNFRQVQQTDGLVLNRKMFNDQVEKFHKTGVIDRALFHYLISTESSFEKNEEVELAFKLLDAFALMYGPIDVDNRPALLVPNFSRGRVSEFKEREAELRFQIEVKFKGFGLPMYRHHQMTVALLNAFPSNGNAIDVKYNGAFIKTETTTIGLIHNQKSKEVLLQVRGIASAIEACWSQLIQSSKAIFEPLKKEQPAYTCLFYCPHCLLKNSHHPVRESPSWCCGVETADRVIDATEASCGDDHNIPQILIAPSANISSRTVKELQLYVANILKQQQHTKEALSQDEGGAASQESPGSSLTALEFGVEEPKQEVLSDEEVDDEMLYPNDDTVEGGIVGMRVAPTCLVKIKELYNETDEVYKMSSPLRGRALIIFSSCKATTHQSKTDFHNMRTLLKDLEFDVVVKQDLTTEAMMESIKHETQNAHHADYGMFVLVIIGHQLPADGVSGKDGRVVDQTALCRLMSGRNFALMDRKPKLVLIHNCHGSASVQQSRLSNSEPKRPLCVSDTIFVRSDSEAAESWRTQAVGSLFVRCFVMVFYQHASHRNMRELLEIVKKKVETKSEALDDEFGKTCTAPQVIVCGATTDRKVYLFPRYEGPRKSWHILDK